MDRLAEDDLVELLRSFFAAYRERYDAMAPAEGSVPLLPQHVLDLVRVNGGRALHFFFTDPAVRAAPVDARTTRLHDVEVHPASTAELKAIAEDSPTAHRDQVRRTADIEGTLYLHFILWPEDGAMVEVLGEIAGVVAEREVRRAGGEVLADEVPGSVRVTGQGKPDWIQPGP